MQSLTAFGLPISAMLFHKNPLITIRTIIFLMMAVSTTVACNPLAIDSSIEAECTPPLFDLAYPYEATRSYEPTPIPLPKQWEPQLSEDQLFSKFAAIGSIVVRNDDEIWLTAPLMRYTPSTKKLTEYSIRNEAGDEFSPYGFFVSKDNTLWALGNKYVSGELLYELYLSRYDEQTDAFEIIMDQDGIFMSIRQPGMYDQMIEDEAGVLWIIFAETLISFDPDTHQAKRVLGIEQGYRLSWTSLELASDGGLWLVGWLPSGPKDNSGRSIRTVLRYDPETNKTRDYGNPNNNGTIGEMFIDHQGRLWAHDFGWLNTSEPESALWNLIIRSSVFINDNPSHRFQYSRNLGFPKLETLDQYIWFTFFNGLVRLDLETSQWCLLSTLPILSIAEDSQNNLWTASQGQIYRYSQNEP